MRLWLRFAASVLVAALAGVLPALADKVTLSGEVTYRERIALPAGATLKVRLIDMTAPGTPTRVEAEAPIGQPGQVPLSFTLNFDDRVLRPDNQHALVAEIAIGVELWFRNAEPYRVDPLAPGAPVMIIADFVGRIGPAPTRPASVEPVPVTPLLDVTWQAVTIRGQPVFEGVESTLSIAGDMRAGGRGGCNSYFAQASVKGESLRFSAVGATLMACASTLATEQERLFFDALGATRSWRIDGTVLRLLGGGGVELVTFQRAVR